MIGAIWSLFWRLILASAEALVIVTIFIKGLFVVDKRYGDNIRELLAKVLPFWEFTPDKYDYGSKTGNNHDWDVKLVACFDYVFNRLQYGVFWVVRQTTNLGKKQNNTYTKYPNSNLIKHSHVPDSSTVKKVESTKREGNLYAWLL